MAHEDALMTVNQLYRQMSSLARSAINAMDDKKLSPLEGIDLAMKAVMLSTSVLAIVKASSADKDELLFVLENGELTLPEGV